DRRPAVRDSGVVPGLGLFWAFHLEADRAAVGMRRSLAIDGFAHHEHAAIMRINQPALGVLHPGLAADRAKYGVVELPRSGNIVAADHGMAEHSVFSLPESHKTGC